MQNAGRGNRINTTEPLIGALIVMDAVSSIESVRKGCEFKQQRASVFRDDYIDSIFLLGKCYATTEAQFKVLTQAVEQLK